MHRRWNLGVLAAIAVAVAVALAAGPPSGAPRAQAPTEVTFAVEADGLALHVTRGDVAVTLKL
ncbi:MAG: hypothetical protein A4S17_13790 [Proteobacteria bacterium HN_bin10]|jgi:hypothetical protein|nr:MAG: hypothetical protein A4S17_13790 [Proteobacteria bacterium HN_bin10]